MKKNSYYAILILLSFNFFLQSSVCAQSNSDLAGNRFQIQMFSHNLNENRTLLIHTPFDYKVSCGTYPVLYLLDGYEHFNHVSELVEFLSEDLRLMAPQMIVVAIVNTDRSRDFTPIKATSMVQNDLNASGSGGGGRFLNFIKDEVIPYVDKNFRTQPYRILGAHSLGGLFGVYANEASPGLFNSSIIISPAFFGENNIILTKFGSFLQRNPNLSGKMYISLGDENSHKVDSLVSQLREHAGKSLLWHFQKYEGETHFSVPYKSFYDGLRFIFDGWSYNMADTTQMVSYEEILKHFNALSKELNYRIIPPESFVNQCAYRQLESNHIERAIRLFRKNAENYPSSSNCYDSLGDAYQIKGDKIRAIANYEKSILLNPANTEGKEKLEKLRK